MACGSHIYTASFIYLYSSMWWEHPAQVWSGALGVDQGGREFQATYKRMESDQMLDTIGAILVKTCWVRALCRAASNGLGAGRASQRPTPQPSSRRLSDGAQLRRAIR